MKMSKTKKLAMCLVTLIASTILFGCAKAEDPGIYGVYRIGNDASEIVALAQSPDGHYQLHVPLRQGTPTFVSLCEVFPKANGTTVEWFLRADVVGAQAPRGAENQTLHLQIADRHATCEVRDLLDAYPQLGRRPNCGHVIAVRSNGWHAADAATRGPATFCFECSSVFSGAVFLVDVIAG